VRIVVDSYAWIEIFIGSSKGSKARDILVKAREVYTPDFVLAEIARKYLREGLDQQIVLARLREITEASDIIPINVESAVESAKCYLELREKSKKDRIPDPSLFDAMILATARILKAKVVTGDKHFKNLNETLWLE